MAFYSYAMVCHKRESIDNSVSHERVDQQREETKEKKINHHMEFV